MDVSATLSNGNTVLVHDEAGGYDFEILDSSLQIIRPFSGSLTGPANGEALVAATASGGFTIRSYFGASPESFTQYDASGAPAGTVGGNMPLSVQAFSSRSNATGATPNGARLSDGGTVKVTPTGSGNWAVQKYDISGHPVGSAFTLTTIGTDNYAGIQVTPLAVSGGYALSYLHRNSAGSVNPTGGSVQDLVVDRFGGDGGLLTQTNLAHFDTGQGPGNINPASLTLVGLADGGAVLAWSGFGQGIFPLTGLDEIRPDGTWTRAANGLGPPTSPVMQLDALADGRYVLTYTGANNPGQPGTTHTVVNTEQSPSLGVTAPIPGTPVSDVMLTVSPVGATLSDASGWTSAAILSNGQIAVVGTVDGGYGSHTAVAHTYNQSGSETGSASLMGYAGAGQTLTPHVTALPYGGFYQVSYNGTTDYEVYNAADQRVLAHNAYLNPNGGFAALTNGGYLLTDFADNTVGLFDASGANVSYFNVNIGGATPTVTALAGGGFAFSLPTEVLGYDASGHQTYVEAPGAEVSRFATATSSLADGSLAEVWLSTDGGQNGNATSLRFETFGANGASGAIQVTQENNPWNAQMRIMPHADGSATILWTHSGGLYAAEYANGAVGPAEAVTGNDFSTMQLVELAGDKIGIVDLNPLQLEAKIFDPATGKITTAAIGTAPFSAIRDGTIHVVGTADGGIAASWHDTLGALRGAVMDPAGHVTVPQGLAGDFLGVDASGHALTLADVNGTPHIQTYGLSDGGLFWSA